MIDLNLLREQPDLVREAIARKKFDCDLDAFFSLDEERRSCIARSEKARADQNSANKEMAAMEKGSPEFLEKIAEMKSIAAEVKELEGKTKEVESRWRDAYLTIPNLPDPSVPDGDGEDDNQVAETWGSPEDVSGDAIPHWDVPWFADLADFERGAKVTGAGFPFFVGDLSRFVRALIQFFLKEAEDAGYLEVSSPLLVNEDSARATGQLPDKEGMMYHASEDDFYLIPTAEVPVTNFFRDEIVESSQLPLKRVCHTPCFRREAGSWGKDVRGLNRLHQFDKVELVKWTSPDTSFDELELLRGNAESLLRKLGLPYRVLLMCVGDIGFSHAKQYDLEVWAGGQKRWLEVSSCSNFTDFQARRAGIRFRDENGKPRAVHTLNGSALAVPRVLAALIENNLDKEGRVKVPDCLRPWFDKDFLTA
ncbi:MAG: serine--tRNA ligase [Opitutae bacterium]|nr:serine--tRNA ligase [Opitutae bacterium]|tara:strand:+ start:250 stop:1515 length:1266 start_codon:yes stop_codon:yes gene_type:complete